VKLLNPFYEAIAWLIVHIHSLLSPVLGKNNGWSWALAIVFLTICMRLLLFPLFVKQTRNMRAMQVLQPRMKELQAKYKNDKEKLNQEMMALWKEHGANPFAGCLPLVLQIPVFIALFRVLNSIKPGCGKGSSTCITTANGSFDTHYGISASLVHSAAISKIFGVPISAAFNSSKDFLHLVGGSTTSTKILSIILIVLMGASTFWTQRQLMARNRASGTGSDQMAQQQKVMLYVLPLTFAIFGYRFPLGVLLYWLTTNLWSMGQQHFIIARMDAKDAAVAAGKPDAPGGPAPGAKPVRPSPPAPGAAGNGAAVTPPASGPAVRRPANRNKNRNRRGRR
jgi:YidC/Oxa1 family membrane protein insertase